MVLFLQLNFRRASTTKQHDEGICDFHDDEFIQQDYDIIDTKQVRNQSTYDVFSAGEQHSARGVNGSRHPPTPTYLAPQSRSGCSGDSIVGRSAADSASAGRDDTRGGVVHIRYVLPDQIVRIPRVGDLSDTRIAQP